MARPIKKGLDYFPLNVFLTGSVEYIECVYGAIGVYVIISLWKRIYEHSYYYKYDDKSPLVCSKEFGNQLELCFPKKDKPSYEIYDEIVKKAVEFGTFDKEMFEKYSILTSKTIQRIYVEAKRKSARELIDERYLLIDIPEDRVITAKTKVIAAITPINAETIPQSKVKESKEKEIKVNESTAEQMKEDKPPTSDAADTVISEYERLIGVPTHNIVELIQAYLDEGMTPELMIRLIEYSVERNARNWQYIEKAILGNLNEGILTVDDYNRHRADRQKVLDNRESAKSSKFNNYTSGSMTDYAKLEEQILDSMLEGDWGRKDTSR